MQIVFFGKFSGDILVGMLMEAGPEKYMEQIAFDLSINYILVAIIGVFVRTIVG